MMKRAFIVLSFLAASLVVLGCGNSGAGSKQGGLNAEEKRLVKDLIHGDKESMLQAMGEVEQKHITTMAIENLVRTLTEHPDPQIAAKAQEIVDQMPSWNAPLSPE